MVLYSDPQGNHHFYLKGQEMAVLTFDKEYCHLNINHDRLYHLKMSEINKISVENAEETVFQPSPHSQQLQNLFTDLGIEQGVCVDIGAYDGLNYSHTYPLFEQGWSGLLLEPDLQRFSLLSSVYRRFPQAFLSRSFVTPVNVSDLLRAYAIPEQFDFLSLDIDSYDFFVLEALLTTHRPTLIVAEVNEVIPPPVQFAVKYDPDFRLQINKRFYGQSLAQLDILCQRHGYAMIDMYYMDVFLIDKKYIDGDLPSLAEIYQRGLLSRPLPAYYADYPFDVSSLLQASPAEALEIVKTGFAEFEERFICQLA